MTKRPADKFYQSQFAPLIAATVVFLGLVAIPIISMAVAQQALLTVSEAKGLKENDPRTIFIDVRSEIKFNKNQIPTSINVPLHFVRTKQYLKTMRVILVGDGYDTTFLLNYTEKLRKKDFTIHVLAGGIAAWHQQGQKLLGDEFKRLELHKLPAFELIKIREQSSIVASINISDQPLETDFPSPGHLPLINPADIEKLAGAIEYKKLDETANILIFNWDGNYDISRLLTKSYSPTLFFLEGGLKEYTEQIKIWQASLKPRHQRLKKIGGCPTCPPQPVDDNQ